MMFSPKNAQSNPSMKSKYYNNPFSAKSRKTGQAIADETLDLNFDEADQMMSFNE